jgi:hypothetical protein
MEKSPPVGTVTVPKLAQPFALRKLCMAESVVIEVNAEVIAEAEVNDPPE